MTETILPHELPLALERVPETIKTLSLDCFDTLLWRDCHAPSDLFVGLGRIETGQRMVGETNARKVERTLRRRSEVQMGAIYAQAMPGASIAERVEAIGEEIALEAKTCFAFAPTVELMRTAKARGLAIIIVSDTYLTANQLLDLIEKSAGAEVSSLIDRVFSSSDTGLSKSEGLLARVLGSTKCRADQVLHIGDNKNADFLSARALGIPAMHLVQFDDAARQRLRYERACSQLIGEGRSEVQGLQPHRAICAIAEPQIKGGAERLGFATLGPAFAAFDNWLREEADLLAKERGATVHWLFMLRDGHLPHIIHQAGGEAASTAQVEISRFTATAASLGDRDGYREHMALEHGLNPTTLARQMLLEDAEIERIIGTPETDKELSEASSKLLRELRTGQRQKLTQRRARAFADRLVAHVGAAVDPKPGDTLMLVDLGYNGSAQNRIDALLQERLGVHVAGRYLLLREMAASGLDKKGLIDARNYDPQFLEALCGNVAVIEQLATCALGSVIDYKENGEPLRKDSSVKGRQSKVREEVQSGAVAFARASHSPPIIRTIDVHRDRGWRDCAAGALTRFMFLPQPDELQVLSSFEHDVNLGSERMVRLFGPEHAGEGMRRRGLF